MKKLLWLALPPLLLAGCNRTTEPTDGTDQVSSGATNATPSQNDVAPAVPATDTPGYLAKPAPAISLKSSLPKRLSPRPRTRRSDLLPR